MAFDRLHALDEEHGREAAACDLIGNVSFGFHNPMRDQPIGKLLTANVPTLQLGFQDALGVVGPFLDSCTAVPLDMMETSSYSGFSHLIR